MGCREILRMNRATVVLCSVLVLAAGCAAPPEEEAPAPEVDPVAENNAALSELAAKYLQAMNRGDADGLAVLYTEDAIRMQTNSKAKVGRDAIRLFAAADYADTNWDMQLRVDESEYSGDLAFVRGTYALSVSPKDAPSHLPGGGEVDGCDASPGGRILVDCARDLEPQPPTRSDTGDAGDAGSA